MKKISSTISELRGILLNSNITDVISWFGSHRDNAKIEKIIPTLFADIINLVIKHTDYNNPNIQNVIRDFAFDWTKYNVPKIATFKKKDMIDSIWALGHLSLRVNDEFIKEWIINCISMVNILNSQELAISILSLSKIQCTSSIQSINNWTYLETKIHMHKYSESDVLVVCGPEGLNLLAMDEFIYHWHKRVLDNISQSKSKDLVQYINALSNINFLPSEHFISKWFIKATDDIDNFNSQALANSIYALSKLGYQNSNVTILLQNTQAHTSNVALMGDEQQDIDIMD